MMRRRDRHSGDLPWGWWLLARENGLEDDEGRRWSTVRDAFWQGRLGFPGIHFAPEQHELLLRVLTSIDARWSRTSEQKHDLFGNNGLFTRFYLSWLASTGMLAHDPKSATFKPEQLPTSLSNEGRSVMLMLQATRDPDWVHLPLREIVDAVAAAGRGPAFAEREQALQAFERSVGRRRHVFARERIHTSFLVTLTGIAAEARMPTMRVWWSQSFTDEKGRDDLFAWLAERVDRWDDWGEMAHQRGGDDFTRHLLTLIVQNGGCSAAVT